MCISGVLESGGKFWFEYNSPEAYDFVPIISKHNWTEAWQNPTPTSYNLKLTWPDLIPTRITVW